MALKDTFPLDRKRYGFEWLRRYAGMAPLQTGVIGAGDFKATPATAGGMRLDVAAGVAVIDGDGENRGLYMQRNDAAILSAVTLAPSDGALARVDRVYLAVNDSDDIATATSDAPAFGVVTGQATTGATLDNPLGAGSYPANVLPLLDVLVPANSTAVAAANTRDRRPWARGAFYASGIDSSEVLATTGGIVTNQVRLECSGGPIEVDVSAATVHRGVNGTTYLIRSFVSVDSAASGASPSSGDIALTHMTTNGHTANLTGRTIITPPAGSRIIGIGTIASSDAAMATTNRQITIRELCRTSGNNA